MASSADGRRSERPERKAKDTGHFNHLAAQHGKQKRRHSTTTTREVLATTATTTARRTTKQKKRCNKIYVIGEIKRGAREPLISHTIAASAALFILVFAARALHFYTIRQIRQVAERKPHCALAPFILRIAITGNSNNNNNNKKKQEKRTLSSTQKGADR